MSDIRLFTGDCREWLPGVPDASVDCVVCDPPYPCIKRSYGTLTEPEWHDLMHAVVGQCRRVLKPSGSAIFILQPNSRKVGSMRLWLFEFIVWAGKEWNLVQDAWWWNIKTMPDAHSIQGRLMRTSLKACVWLGSPDCYRDQDSVLEPPSPRMLSLIRQAGREDISGRKTTPSGHGSDRERMCRTVTNRGGVTPFNVLCMHHGYSQRSAGSYGHPAGTPLDLMDWWLRYLCPPGGTACDPFLGSGTTALAALRRGLEFVGGDKEASYVEIARKRLADERSRTPLLT